MRVIHSIKWKDLIGRRFGKLTVVEIIDDGPVEWFGCLINCRCDCGNMKTVGRRYLIRGQTKSCGCIQRISNSLYKGLQWQILK